MKNISTFIVLIAFVLGSNFQAFGQTDQSTKSALLSLIDSHLTEKQSGVYLDDCTVSSFYQEGNFLIVKGKFLHSGTVTNVWKPYVAKVRINQSSPRVVKLCYWKYWVLTGSWTLICTDGSHDIDPMPERPDTY